MAIKQVEEIQANLKESANVIKKKSPTIWKVIVSVLAAIITGIIGFVGGIIGLTNDQQTQIKDTIQSAFQSTAIVQPVETQTTK